MEQDIKKERSPKAPKFSLQEAIDKARRVYQKAGKAGINRAVLSQAIGYSGISGAALTSIATLRQYGLLDANGDSYSISQLALKLLHPVNAEQELKIKRESVLLSPVFSALHTEGFGFADEDIICNHLIQGNFSPDSARTVARVFKENIEFAKLSEPSNISTGHEVFEPQTEQVQTISQPQKQPIEPPADASLQPELSLPLDSGYVVKFPIGISQDDFDLINGTLQLWKKKIVKAEPSPVTAPAPATAKSDQQPKTLIGFGDHQYLIPASWSQQKRDAFIASSPTKPLPDWERVTASNGRVAYVVPEFHRVIGSGE